ncbi:MAG TPA: hypothetical protein VFA75_17970 [Nevskia sp.]|nr:hypothetical protein [Nevskia sp.]
MTPQGQDDKMQGSVEVSPFDLGRLFAEMRGLDARLVEIKRDTAITLEKLEARIETRMSQFAESLQKLADGYVRREELTEAKKDVDALGAKHRELEQRLGLLEVQGGRAEPLMKGLTEILKYLLIAGVGVIGGHFFH